MNSEFTNQVRADIRVSENYDIVRWGFQGDVYATNAFTAC